MIRRIMLRFGSQHCERSMSNVRFRADASQKRVVRVQENSDRSASGCLLMGVPANAGIVGRRGVYELGTVL